MTRLSRSCFMHKLHIRDLRRIRPMLDLKTASTIATSIVHAKLDYSNSLFLNIDVTQINRLQAIQNALARAVTKTPKHHHPRQQTFRAINGAHLASQIRGELGYAHWTHKFIALLGTK